MLNVMSVQVFFISAFLAGVVIALINSNAPLSDIAPSAGAFVYKRYAAFPIRGFIPYKIFCPPNKRAYFRACFLWLALKMAECIATYNTYFRDRRISFEPTSAPAIFRRIRFICLYAIIRTAEDTLFYYLSVFHALYYNIFTNNYGAVILERYATAFPAEKIEQVTE
jgi:hypothetical protein